MKTFTTLIILTLIIFPAHAGKKIKGVGETLNQAIIETDRKANDYSKGMCYTPTSEKNCKEYDRNGTKEWKCKTKAHHHCGSCEKSNRTWSIDDEGESKKKLCQRIFINGKPINNP